MNPAEDYILNQREPYRSMLLHLQSVIELTVPTVALKYKYRVPFYYIDGKPFCYLNQSKDYIDLGFWNGAYLSVHIELLYAGGRKVIKSLRYKSLEDIDNEILIAVLNDAFAVKEKKFYSK